jgi:UDP-N-acetylglucosamine 2-epimerase (non-hydrolysing)
VPAGLSILVGLGTRPEIVKLAPVVQGLRKAGFPVRTVATGQHYSPSMSDSFFEELGLQPDARWTAGAGDDGDRIGAMLASAIRELDDSRPDLVLLLGDTWTVPLFCLAARRSGIPVAHLEAGLRSFNATSMEEVNRRVAAATASLHLAPTDLAARFLHDEGVPRERVHVVGNPVIDVLRQRGVASRPVSERSGVVVTAHRATNVDDPERLRRLVEIVVGAARDIGPVTFPLHPRTADRLQASGDLSTLRAAGVRLLDPLPYDDMLSALAGCRVVLTDSGGLQEEASYLGVPVVVLRRSTPRWEGVGAGTSVLVGLDVDLALDAATRFCTPDEQARVAGVACPYGDGRTATRVADLLADPATASLLELAEPDFVGKAVPM